MKISLIYSILTLISVSSYSQLRFENIYLFSYEERLVLQYLNSNFEPKNKISKESKTFAHRKEQHKNYNIEYDYDATGKIASIIKVRSKKNKIVEKWFFSFNEKKIIKEIIIDFESETKYRYQFDYLKLDSLKLTILKNETPFKCFLINLNSDNLIKTIVRVADEKIIDKSKLTFSYTIDNELKTAFTNQNRIEFGTDSMDRLISLDTFSRIYYDSSGRVSEFHNVIEYISNKEEAVTSYILKYKYDSNKNLKSLSMQFQGDKFTNKEIEISKDSINKNQYLFNVNLCFENERKLQYVLSIETKDDIYSILINNSRFFSW